VQSIFAQQAEVFLVDKTFVSNTDYICELTPEYDPCAGLQSYLILEFTTNDVFVIEKDISGCGAEYINYNAKHKWCLGTKMQILIQSEEEEMKYTFIKDLTLMVKDGVLVGYSKLNSESPKQFDFEQSLTGD